MGVGQDFTLRASHYTSASALPLVQGALHIVHAPVLLIIKILIIVLVIITYLICLSNIICRQNAAIQGKGTLQGAAFEELVTRKRRYYHI